MTQLNIPYRFVAGTKAKANEVNENFDAIVNEIDEIYSQILENSNIAQEDYYVLDGKIDALENKVDDFLASYCDVTKFCVNSGKINSSTLKPDILSANSTVISFACDFDNPIKATNCLGNSFEITNIDDLFLPTLNDGVYTIYLNPEGEVMYYANSVEYVDKLPNAPYVNEVCVLKSAEPVIAYKYSGVAWEEFLSVPLGAFEILNANVVSLETFAYNQNGYNININSFPIDLSTNGWTKLPNGLIFQWGSYSSYGTQTHNFPIAFPHACLGIVNGHNYNNLGAAAHVNLRISSKSQFSMAGAMNAAEGTLSVTAYIFAFGY